MNNKIFNSLLAAGLTLALAGCGENTWNDHFLDGFTGDVEYKPTDSEGTYTLTDDDYASISKLLQDKATTDEEIAAAKAIGKNLFFDTNGLYPASVALPLFMNTSAFPYYLDEPGSNVAVTYNEASEVPAEISQIAGADKYTVSEEDYKSIWGSDENYTASFAPSHTAARSIPKLLKAAFADAENGKYVIVSYNTSAVDPVFNAAEEPKFEMSNILGSLKKGDDVEFSGVVMATSTQGPIVSDASGSVFVYQPTNNSDLKIGDQVTVSSTVDTYNYGFQIKKGANAMIKGNQPVSYPTPKSWTGSEIDQFVADAMASGASPINPIYSTFNGKAIVSNYINIQLEGTTVQISPYGVSDEVKAMFTNDANVTIEGYVMAIASKGKYFNTIVTKVNGIDINATPKAVASRAVTIASSGENSVYYYNGTDWAPAAGVTALNPADYTAMGVENNALQDAKTYIPIYLKNKFPYAVNGDMEYVVYNGSKCDLFVFDGTNWDLNNNGLETVTARFVRKAEAWSFVKYLGKAVFNLYTEEELQLDCSYMFVAGNKAATPVDKSKSFGYLNEMTVEIDNGVIVLPTDKYAFNLLSKYVDENTLQEYEVPEGSFLLQDSNGRFFYMSGTFSSPNFKDSPVSGGKIGDEFLWNASLNSDGTWNIISNTKRIMHLSISHSSFGFYDSSSEDYVLPNLYKLDN